MANDLALRKTVIGGETAPDDYVVIWDGLKIGRIFKSVAVGGGFTWSWSVALPNVPQPSRYRGGRPSLEEAKAAFRAAWEEMRSEISYEQIQEARRIDADRSRPWHRKDAPWTNFANRILLKREVTRHAYRRADIEDAGRLVPVDRQTI